MSDSNHTESSAADLLAHARESASKEREYDSAVTRQSIEDKFKAAFDEKIPYSWQVDVTEALLLGLDSVVIAGTGSGKTMPFGMPLLLDEAKDKIVVVISPLNELEAEQAERFRKLGLTATAVNAEVYNAQLHKEVEERKHRVLLSSPEMCLEHPRFSKLLRTPEFTQHILAFVVDEAHCISQWGDQFRTKYAELGKLRSFVPDTIPFLVTSATLPPHILNDVWHKLCLSQSRTFTVNLGNDRPNITPILSRMRGAASDLKSLAFAVDEVNNDKPFVRTIIYFNSRDLAYKGHRYLRSLVPREVRYQIDFLHAGRSRRAKRKVTNKFRDGRVNILCATEVAGMGMDIQDVPRVIQYMVPPSLSVWTQRLGRAGRSGEPATVILLVEPSVYQLKKSKNVAKPEDSDDEDEEDEGQEDGESDHGGQVVNADPIYRKKVEEGMRKWIETTECRRIVADAYFNNPPRTSKPLVPCCDICVLKKAASDDAELTPEEGDLMVFYDRIAAREVLATGGNDVEAREGGESGEEDRANENTVLQTTKRSRRPGPRHKERLEACRNALMAWRHKTWQKDFKDCVWGPNVLLPETVLTKLASRARLQTLDDIKEEIPDWIWADEYGDAVLKLLEPIDRSWHEDNERQKAENKAKRARLSAEKKVIRDEERLAKAREATAQQKAMSSSTARPALHPLYPAPNYQHVFHAMQPHAVPSYPHPTQFTTAYPYPYPVFVPCYPPNS